MYLGLFLISCSILLIQISLTRIFSIAVWHHFAFMVVGIAFLGFGAGGTVLMMRPSYVKAYQHLSNYTLLFSSSIVLSLLFNHAVPFDPAQFSWDRYQLLYLCISYLVWALPFFFSGLILSILYTVESQRVHRLYFSDLLGSASGCITALLIFPAAGGEGSLLIASLGAVLAHWCFNSGRRLLPGISLLLILLVLIIAKPEPLLIKISPFKELMMALSYPGAKIIQTGSDLASRVDIVESGAVRFAPGLSLKFEGSLPPQVGMTVDGNNLTAVTRFTGRVQDLEFVSHLPSSLPYSLARPRSTVTLQSGGGLLGLSALYYGSQKIFCLEPNVLLIKMMRNHLQEFSGGITDREPLVWVAEEGRTFLARHRGPYDLIQMGINDALGAVSIGLYGLRESYDLTVEAFEQVLSVLSENGLFCATRYLLPPPRAEARLFNTALTALMKSGSIEPARHLAAIRSWGAFTLVMKKSPLTSMDLERLRGFCGRLGFDVVYYPGISSSEVNRYNRLTAPQYFELLSRLAEPETRLKVLEAYPFDLSATYDNRPFFFHFFKVGRALEIFRELRGKWGFFLEGGFLVYLTMAQSLVIGFLLILLPMPRLLHTGLKIPGRSMTYFFFLGVGYMLLEVTLMERFILFLGKPVYAFTVTLASLLASTGLGSLCSLKLKKSVGKKLGRLWIVPLIVIILVYASILGQVLEVCMRFSFLFRAFFTLIIISPLGFLMGFPFPLGIAFLERTSPAFIPWAWSINACSGAMGASLAMVIALHFGFAPVTALAAGCYLVALILFKGPSDHWHKYYTQ
jgi:hypothetical protein